MIPTILMDPCSNVHVPEAGILMSPKSLLHGPVGILCLLRSRPHSIISSVSLPPLPLYLCFAITFASSPAAAIQVTSEGALSIQVYSTLDDRETLMLTLPCLSAWSRSRRRWQSAKMEERWLEVMNWWIGEWGSRKKSVMLVLGYWYAWVVGVACDTVGDTIKAPPPPIWSCGMSSWAIFTTGLLGLYPDFPAQS